MGLSFRLKQRRLLERWEGVARLQAELIQRLTELHEIEQEVLDMSHSLTEAERSLGKAERTNRELSKRITCLTTGIDTNEDLKSITIEKSDGTTIKLSDIYPVVDN